MFWTLFEINDVGEPPIDIAYGEGQEYQAVRIISKDSGQHHNNETGARS